MPPRAYSRALLPIGLLALGALFCAMPASEDELLELADAEATGEAGFATENARLTQLAVDSLPTATTPPGATAAPSPTKVPTAEPTLAPTDLPTEPPPPQPLVRFDDPIADILNCFDRQPVEDPAADVVAVNVYAADSGILSGLDVTHTGRVVEVETQAVITDTVANDFSFAVVVMSEVTPTAQQIMYEIHDEIFRIGMMDAQFNVLPGTEAAALLTGAGRLLFLLPDDFATFAVRAFHTAVEAAQGQQPATQCDSAPDEGVFEVP